MRVRISDNKTAELTIKSGKGIERDQYPQKITLDFARQAFALCSHELGQIRHFDGPLEIDFMQPPLAGITLIERKFREEVEEVEKPLYVDEWVEVTDSLTKHHLARLATILRQHEFPAVPFVFSSLFSPLPQIVITGGPGSGKSTVMELLKKEKPNLQFMPEVASIVIGQLGIRPNEKINNFFQRLIHDTASLFEITSAQYALLEGLVGMVLDRGLPDGAAYFNGGIREYEDVLSTSIEDEYARYKLVICMDVPPADVYEAIKANNPSRSESYVQARELGDKIFEVWMRHPNFVFVSNDYGWNAKVTKVRKVINQVIK